jgi:membrane fusion protein, multidrug efflux system
MQDSTQIYVNFSLAQQDAPLVAPGQKVKLRVDALPGEVFEGTINAIDPMIDMQTRTLKAQALLPNPGERLLPGMYAQVTVIRPDAEKVIAVPVSSVSYAPYGDSVFVIEKMKGQDGHEYLGARQQIVSLGRKRGDRVALTAGLKSGERVVTSGVFKLRNGSEVKIDEKLTPSNEINPQPADT